jgi:hypothetical protein
MAKTAVYLTNGLVDRVNGESLVVNTGNVSTVYPAGFRVEMS